MKMQKRNQFTVCNSPFNSVCATMHEDNSMQELMVKLSNYSAKHMRAEPWGLVRMDHGSIMIRLTPGEVTVLFFFFI